MKKVLMIISKSEVGGAQRWLRDVVVGLQDDFVFALYTNDHGWLVSQLQNVCSVELSPKIENFFSFGEIWRLRNFIRKSKIDLVVCSSASAGVLGRIASFRLGVSVVYVSHGWSAIYHESLLSPVFKFAETLLANITDAIVCVSASDAQKAIRLLNISPSKLKIIRNSVHVSHFGGFDQIVCRRKLLCVSRFAPPKRIDLLCSAVANMDVHLTVVGDGPLHAEILAKHGSCLNIDFVGEVQNFCNFADFDIFVLISDSEGLPVSAIEAMGHGLPLVLSDVGGCSELIDGNGSLVQNRLDDVQNGILDCIKNYDLYSRRSIANYKLNWSYEKMISEYKNMFLHL